MCLPFSKDGLSNSCDIQNALRKYNLGVTLILILLQETSSCCLWVGVVLTNVSIVTKSHEIRVAQVLTQTKFTAT